MRALDNTMEGLNVQFEQRQALGSAWRVGGEVTVRPLERLTT